MPDICTNTEVFAYLGIESPTSTQIALMTMLRKGAEAAIRRYCRWNLTEDTFTYYLPDFSHATGSTVITRNYYTNDRYRNGLDRLQLPQMYVKSITSIHEDLSASSGSGLTDFGAETELTDGEEFFLEKDLNTGYSMQGGVLRKDKCWSSIAGTIKAVFVAGFSTLELDGVAADLKFEVIREIALRWQSQGSLANDGATGPVKSEKLGDYAVSYGDGGDNSSGQTGLSDRLKKFLSEAGYEFYAVAG